MAAYVSWVNSQLRRKPGLNPITNLRHDLQDGVVLTQLIEIVGKYTHARTNRSYGVQRKPHTVITSVWVK